MVEEEKKAPQERFAGGDSSVASPPKRSAQELIDEAIAKGAILSVMYFDVHSQKSEDVQPMLVDLISRISREAGIISAVGEVEETIEQQGIFTSSAEVTVLARDFGALANIAVRYGPFGIEVIRPDTIKLSLGQAQSLLLNLSSVGQEFAQYVLKKVMTPEERARFEKELAARAEMGRRMMEKKVGEKP